MPHLLIDIYNTKVTLKKYVGVNGTRMGENFRYDGSETANANGPIVPI